MIENMCTIGLIALAAAAGLIIYRFMIVAKDDFDGYAAGFLLSMVGIVLFVLSGIFRSKGWWKACNKIIELRNDHRENTPDNEI